MTVRVGSGLPCRTCGLRPQYASYRDCQPCLNTLRREKRRTDPAYRERQNEYQRRKTSDQIRGQNVRRTYRISLEEYDKIMSNPCAICGDKATHLDHDHLTNKIRGPLCQHCNMMLGQAKDDPRRLYAAARYIRSHRGGG